jgi:hypothetical protein
MRIEDGKGSGKFVEVNDSHRLLCDDVTETRGAYTARSFGKFYSFATPVRDVTTTEGAMIWFYNGSDTESFIIHSLIGSFNGDSTNHNRCCYLRFYGGMTAPSGNATAGSLSNTNTGSANSATGSLIYYWDNVSTGMTVASNGSGLGTIILGNNAMDLNIEGTIIISPGVTFGITAQAESATGKVAFICSGFFEEL